MKTNPDPSFDEMFRDAEKRTEFWMELASLDLTEAIRARMKSKRITQSELARRMKVSRPRVSQILKGGNVALSTIVSVAMHLGCQVKIRLKPQP